MSFLDDWKEWSTAKKAISIIAVCCIAIFIVAIIGGGLSSDKNTSPTTTSQNTTANSNDTAAISNDTTTEQAHGVQVHIIYDGQWQGAMSDGGSTNSISGTGEETIDMADDAHIVSANAQKMDGGSGTLTIQILKDGNVVKEATTNTEYGVAQVSSSV